MDPELRSVIARYSVVGLVLTGAVVWAVVYTNQNATPATAAPTAAEQPERSTPPTIATPEAAKDAAPSMPGRPAMAPSEDRLFVDRMGAKRVDCPAACQFEAYCGLRDVDVCLASSCEPGGQTRKVNTSDFKWKGADNCGQIAATPCEEACWKKGECAGDHDDDGRCTSACLTLVRQEPAPTYAESRCVIESQCSNIPLCVQTGP